MDALWVAGNHERAATGAIGTEDFNPEAAAAAEWTMARLSPKEATALDELPEILSEGPFTLVHGTLRWPIWEYLASHETALAHLALMTTPFGFVGHTHVPLIAIQEPHLPDECEMYRLGDGARVPLTAGKKIVVNPGSVGQPRDGDPRASYAVYDTDAAAVTINRVDYDIKHTQRLMEDAGLPLRLIERLSSGR
jgi:diadenosine tetraphosphatase ApaH/serine/threonine PP2A family protein phosphatase